MIQCDSCNLWVGYEHQKHGYSMSTKGQTVTWKWIPKGILFVASWYEL